MPLTRLINLIFSVPISFWATRLGPLAALCSSFSEPSKAFYLPLILFNANSSNCIFSWSLGLSVCYPLLCHWQSILISLRLKRQRRVNYLYHIQIDAFRDFILFQAVFSFSKAWLSLNLWQNYHFKHQNFYF